MRHSAKKILTCMLNLLSKPGGWTQHHLAKPHWNRKDKVLIEPKDEDAYSFCLLGALSHCNPTGTHRDLNQHARKARRLIYEAIPQESLRGGKSSDPGFTLMIYNDTKGRTKKEVLEVLQEAINSA